MGKGDYILDDQVGYLLRLVSQRHAAIFQAHSLGGLTAQQFAALVRIGEAGNVSQNLLGRLAAMDVATIKGVVDRLRDKGLVEVKPDPTDKRRMVISLNRAGAKVLQAMTAQGRQISEKTLAPLDAAERKSLLELLRKLT